MNNEKDEKSRDIRDRLKDIEEILSQEVDDHTDSAFRQQYLLESLKYCLGLSKELLDENDSLWMMLEEIKASEIQNHSEEFRQMMDRKLLEIKLMMLQKPSRA